MVASLKDDAFNFGSVARSSIIRLIADYNSLVYSRSKFGTSQIPDSSASTAVESLLSRFAEDAVNSTYGLVWNSVGLPFEIRDSSNPDQDLSNLTELLAEVLEEHKTGFHKALRHSLKCYLEYGSGWVYVFQDNSNKIVHRTFSCVEIARSLDIYGHPKNIYLDRGEAYTIVSKRDDGLFNVYQHNVGDKLNKAEGLKNSPICELSQTGKYDDSYPLGYGLKALSDLKRYDNVVKCLTESSAIQLKPIIFQSSEVNRANKSSVFLPDYNSVENPLIVDLAPGANFPVGFLQPPIKSADAWRVFEIVSLNLRESFGFINRLLTIKDDAQMTATEANIRSQADLSQIRDTIEAVFSFLSDLHRAQLDLLFSIDKRFSEWKKLDTRNLDFFHTSIFKKQADSQKLQEISMGLDLAAKAVQVGDLMQKAGVDDVVDQKKVLKEVAETTKLALRSERSEVALSSLLRNLTDI